MLLDILLHLLVWVVVVVGVIGGCIVIAGPLIITMTKLTDREHSKFSWRSVILIDGASVIIIAAAIAVLNSVTMNSSDVHCGYGTHYVPGNDNTWVCVADR